MHISIVVNVGPWPNRWNDLDALLRLQNILVFVCGHPITTDDDAEYKELRTCLLRNPEFNDIIPAIVRSNRDLASFESWIRDVKGGTKKFVRDAMEPLLDRAEALDTSGFLGANLKPDNPEHDEPDMIEQQAISSADWTGEQSLAVSCHLVRQLAPEAIKATTALITYLENKAANGGPPIEDRSQALEDLRNFHRSLGELLSAAEAKDPVAGFPGLIGEVQRFGQRVSQAFSDDPVPFALSGVLFAICSAFGSPTVGSFLGGTTIALGRKK